MHVIFGISALVMLGGTIWMLAKDHNREWRQWQLDDRARERWTIEAQLAQAEADSTVAARAACSKDLDAAQSSKVDAAARRAIQAVGRGGGCSGFKDDGKTEAPADFAKLDAALAEIDEAENGSAGGGERPQGCARARWTSSFTRPSAARTQLLTKKKFVAADQTAAISARGIAVGEGKPTDKIEEEIQIACGSNRGARCEAGDGEGLSRRAGNGR